MENVSLRTIVLFTNTRGKRCIMVSGTCFLTLKRIIFSKRNKKSTVAFLSNLYMCISTNVSILSFLPSNNEKLKKTHDSTNAVAFLYHQKSISNRQQFLISCRFFINLHFQHRCHNLRKTKQTMIDIRFPRTLDFKYVYKKKGKCADKSG